MAVGSKSWTGNGRVRTSASACRCAAPPVWPPTAPARLHMRPELPAILLAALLAGCGSLPSAGSRTTVTAPAAGMDAVQATQLNSLIGDLTRVVTGTPTEQAEIMADARQDF